MNDTDVVVTGVGPVSAIGSGAEVFWSALVEGRSGIGPITLCSTSGSRSKIAAEVRDFDLGRIVPRGRALARRAPRAVQLGLAAAALALGDADLGSDRTDPESIGIVAGTSLGNLREGIPLVASCLDEGATIGSDRAFALFHHSTACMVSALFDLRGPIQTVSTGCNAGLDGVGSAMRLIQTRQADAIVVIGSDCELVPEVLALLNAADALSTRFNDDPVRASRPFDADRDGNVIGEGAAALVLESGASARARGARVYARIAGFASRAAGRGRRYSAHRPDLNGGPAVRSLTAAIDEARWTRDDVDLVSCNGSSSVRYDRLEAIALAEALGEAFPRTRTHSIKSMLGQHGAGSSALQAAAACLSIHHGIAPPTLNCETPDPSCGPIRVVTEAEASAPRRVLAHSIGFGGFYYSAAAFEAPA